jgi:DtxR family Mn-dependent transcriptional regulator
MTESSLTQAAQDYLKAVYHLGRPGKSVNTNELAEALEVAPASVTGMLKKLSKDGYLDYTPRQGAGLTSKGLQVALEVIRHHRLLEAFFVQRLGMDWTQAHREAEILEHFISEELEQLIDTAMGHPQEDPHGAPIPQLDGSIAEREFVCLADVARPGNLVIRRVRAESAELLDYLRQMNLVPGNSFELVAVAPFDGPLSLRVDGRELHIGRTVAHALYVEPPEDAASAAPENSNGTK